jgi:hypothetical protein
MDCVMAEMHADGEEGDGHSVHHKSPWRGERERKRLQVKFTVKRETNAKGFMGQSRGRGKAHLTPTREAPLATWPWAETSEKPQANNEKETSGLKIFFQTI